MTEERPLAVVATAGHVDHGKSSLILGLTGTDPDRLAEEKRRGLTIELGYAWCTLPSGREIGFVDVPGHERFVRTMLAGVGPVRLVLFVVAADEGWKPQSEEHLEIVDVLGVDGAVIALTKTDLVDPDGLALAVDDVRDRVAGTALENAPLVPCSSRTGEGLDRIRDALDAMLAAAPEPERDGRMRWFVDRIFTIRGAGTVATGTLTGGPLTVGDEVEVHPAGVRARVRTLQSHQRDLERALPVSRVAANLAGPERDQLARGDVVTHPGAWRATDVIEARATPVRSASRPLTARGAFTLHAGAAERPARLRIYDGGTLPLEGGYVRIRLAAPLVLDVGDRFVLRESGRRRTVAGGVVLDVRPPPRPGPDADARLGARLGAEREDLPALLIAERSALPETEVALLTGVRPSRVDGARLVGSWWVADPTFDSVTDAARTHLERFHASDPLAAGEEVSTVRATVLDALRSAGAPTDPGLADALLEEFARAGTVARDGSLVRLAAHAAESPSADVERLLETVRAGEPTPPSVPELVSAGFGRSLIDATVRSGTLVRTTPEIVHTSAFVEDAIAAIREAGEAGITVSALRERLGTSRRFAVPLVEHLDRVGVTRRSGDVRVLRGR